MTHAPAAIHLTKMGRSLNPGILPMQHARRKSAAMTWPVKIRLRPALSANQRCKHMVNNFQLEACHIQMAVPLVHSTASSAAAVTRVKTAHIATCRTSPIRSSAVTNGKRNSARGDLLLEKSHGKHGMPSCRQWTKWAQFTAIIGITCSAEKPVTQTMKIRHCSSSISSSSSSNTSSSKIMLQCCLHW